MGSSPSSDAGAASSGLSRALIALGNVVFRYRNGLAPVLLGIVILFTRPRPFAGSRRLDLWWDTAGVLVAFAGQALRVLVIGLAYIQRGGKNRGIAADKLVIDGLFAHVRHPLYAGNFLLLSGLMMIWNAPGAYLLLAIAGLALFSMARAEEAFLGRKFGAEFDAYCARVPRFIPNLRGVRQTMARFTFDWKRVVRKEYGTTFAWTSLVVVLLAVQALEWDGITGLRSAAVVLVPVWLVILVAWATARWMKKTGRLASPD